MKHVMEIGYPGSIEPTPNHVQLVVLEIRHFSHFCQFG